MKIKGNKLYFKNGQFLNLTVFGERVMLPAVIAGAIALFYLICFYFGGMWR